MDSYYYELTKMVFNSSLLSKNDFGDTQETIKEKGFEYRVFFSKPNISINKKKIVLFINKRLVKNDVFEKAINGAYEAAVMAINSRCENYFCFLDLELFTNLINVNICVKKSDVRIEEELSIASYIGMVLSHELNQTSNVICIDNLNIRQKTLDNKIINDVSFQQTQQHKQIFERYDPNEQKVSDMFRRQSHEISMQGNLTNSQKEANQETADNWQQIFENVLGVLTKQQGNKLCRVCDKLKGSSLVGLTNPFTLLVQWKTFLLEFDGVDFLTNFLKFEFLNQAFSQKIRNNGLFVVDEWFDGLEWFRYV